MDGKVERRGGMRRCRRMCKLQTLYTAVLSAKHSLYHLFSFSFLALMIMQLTDPSLICLQAPVRWVLAARISGENIVAMLLYC